ncbi:MAG: HAD-IA family hydrolase [Planctomycetota bacterium]
MTTPSQTLPSAILLDLDGTLIDSLEDIARSVDFVRSEFGLDPLGSDGVKPLIGRGLAALLADALAEASGGEIATEEQIRSGVRLYDDHHGDHLLTATEPYPEVEQILRSWHDDGHRLAVVTNKPERFAVTLVEAFGWQGMLEVVIGGDTTTRKKPHPDPLHLALDRLGSKAEDAVMIGDSAPDVLGGRNAGTMTVAVTYGFTERAHLEALEPDLLWDRFGGPWPGE